MLTNEVINKIERNELNDVLYGIYLDLDVIERQKERYIRIIKEYENRFGKEEINIFSTPGRSEVSGNHTDHQHGKVLTCSISLDIVACVGRSNDVEIFSDGRHICFQLDDISEKEEEKGTSIALVKGVMAKLKENGHKIGGFKAVMSSDVLVGSGLSSSAAFEVMIGEIINSLYNEEKISKLEIAQVSQFAENVYYGKPSGLMDQCGCGFGGLVGIDFNDPKKPIISEVNVNFEDFNTSLCVVDTHADHENLTHEYAAIPAEMKKVANYFKKDFLREITLEQLLNKFADVRKECGDRAVVRSIHVLLENDRVDKAICSLNNGDFEGFKNVITSSGNSSFKYLQNIYAVSDYDNQAVSLAIATSEIVLGNKGVCRVHGGGFAGTILAFVDNDFVKEYAKKMDNLFGKGSCHVLKVNSKGTHKVI